MPVRLLYPWDSPGKSTGVGSHFVLQGIFPNPVFAPGSTALQAESSPSEPLLYFFLAGWGLCAARTFSIFRMGWEVGRCSLAAVLRLLLLGSMDFRVTGFCSGPGTLEHRLSSQEDYYKRRHWRCNGCRKKPSRSLPYQTQSRKFW